MCREKKFKPEICVNKMSSNISKWFPKAASQKSNDEVFAKTKHIERELRKLANKFTTNINFNLLDYYVSRPKRLFLSCAFPCSIVNYVTEGFAILKKVSSIFR